MNQKDAFFRLIGIADVEAEEFAELGADCREMGMLEEARRMERAAAELEQAIEQTKQWMAFQP